MPAKYRNKSFLPNSYYHIYNKGIDGRDIFCDDADYQKFLSIMESYLVNEKVDTRFKEDKPSIRAYKDQMRLNEEVAISAYCLLSNHFHLLVHQSTINGITKFMRRVNTGYVMYFNKRYGRSGPLFENVYRGVKIEDHQLLALTKFIHLNPVTRVVKRFGPVETVTGTRPEDYTYSSYGHYIGIKQQEWVHIVEGAIDGLKYRKYTEDARNNDLAKLKGLMIDGIE